MLMLIDRYDLRTSKRSRGDGFGELAVATIEAEMDPASVVLNGRAGKSFMWRGRTADSGKSFSVRYHTSGETEESE
ncbi:MAG: hypothetical protein SNJ75_10515 [Gemmataceae bacterium]